MRIWRDRYVTPRTTGRRYSVLAAGKTLEEGLQSLSAAGGGAVASQKPLKGLYQTPLACGMPVRPSLGDHFFPSINFCLQVQNPIYSVLTRGQGPTRGVLRVLCINAS